MGLMLFLRDNFKISYFREIVLAILEEQTLNDMEKIYMTSLSFQYNPYYYKVFEDELGDSIIKRINIDPNVKFIFITGSENTNNNPTKLTKEDQLRCGINYLICKIKANPFSMYKVSKNVVKDGNLEYIPGWHAKLFLVKSKNGLYGIVGSSNFTEAAFSYAGNKNDNEKYKRIFLNYEADVFLWENNVEEEIKSFLYRTREKLKSYINENRIGVKVPFIIFEEDVNNNYSTENALKDLINRIENGINGGSLEKMRLD
ncbi:MAG: hypothetical protein M1521_08705 [Thermotogae bacterium]|jgi:hypothetical protein|nr:hypothetical protein [Thermotogota bacterium]